MTFRKQVFAATGFILFSFMLPLDARAANFSQLFVFGDSLSDTGNVFNESGDTFPPENLGYFNGRFSNGPIWIDYLSQDLGLSSPTPISDVLEGTPPMGGLNYAFGGATTTTANTVDSNLFGLPQEIGAFTVPLRQNNQTADPNALYIVWAGSNDYLPTTSSDFTPFTTPETTVSNIAGAVSALAVVGAKNIMVVNLPNLGNIPLTNEGNPFPDPAIPPGTSARLNRLTEAHNALLSTTLDNLDNSLNEQNVNLISVNVNSLFQDIIEPTRSPFTNTTDPCLLNPACTNPNEFLFWDALHPTTAGHRLIGQLAFNSLQGESAPSVPEPTSILSLLFFGMLGVGAIAKRNLSKEKASSYPRSTNLGNRF
jgi:phospholipase/lecithinase/hemolysin